MRDRLAAEISDNTELSQETDIHAPGWIRTRNSSDPPQNLVLDRSATGVVELCGH
jgi:hypothetical protein